MWMAGYAARTHSSEGVLQDLWVKALALEDGAGGRAVIVTSDLLGLPRNLSEQVCARLQQKLELRREAVMLTTSHTHSGPVLRDALYDIYPLDAEQLAKIEAYSQQLETQMVEAVEMAFARLEPATLATGMGNAGFAINRRNNTEKDVEEGKPVKGPVDHSVPVLRVSRSNGELLAIVFGYACHNTTLDSYQWSGDYAGFAQDDLEKDHPGATSLFFAGCGADANPIPRRSVALCEKYGRQLADAVNHALANSMKPLDAKMEAAFSRINLRLAPPPSREELIARTKSETDWIRRWARRMLAEMEEGKQFAPTYPYPVQVWRLGNRQLWIALGGEVVVDYALRLKHELGDSIWATAYANDVMAYIPSVRVLNEGGYEGARSMMVYGLPSVWDATIEEHIVREVHRLVNGLKPRHNQSKVEGRKSKVTGQRVTGHRSQVTASQVGRSQVGRSASQMLLEVSCDLRPVTF
jgi:hypothetical protein